ncbi:hypothetical protein [Leisingera sp. F5]|uniref:hypothetical protein n=1 Tax=Leisingera sp. F5 TaxID=1813816 RepID=UPI000AFDF237|nr:hypothetical protein [Leisingera sp. F5]
MTTQERIHQCWEWYEIARSYFIAATRIHGKDKTFLYVHDLDLIERIIRLHPLTQLLGLSYEQTFKAMRLLFQQKEKPPFGHDLEDLYQKVPKRKFRLDALDLRIAELCPSMPLPSKVEALYKVQNGNQEDWFKFRTQLSALNSYYFKFPNDGAKEGFRARYPSGNDTYKEFCVEALFAALDEAQKQLRSAIESEEAELVP